MSKVYTIEEVKELCIKAYEEGFTNGHYDEQEKTGEWWVSKNINDIDTNDAVLKGDYKTKLKADFYVTTQSMKDELEKFRVIDSAPKKFITKR